MATETPEECNDCNKRQQQSCDKGLLMGQKTSSNDSDTESNPSRISLNLLQTLQAFMYSSLYSGSLGIGKKKALSGLSALDQKDALPKQGSITAPFSRAETGSEESNGTL